MKRTLSTSLLFILLIPLLAQNDEYVEIGVVEKLDQYIPLDARLVDINGDTVIIGDLIDKPTILNFVYYRCPGICSPLMDGLSKAMDGNDLVLGEDYQALTISFDPREGPFLAVKKKN
ncbi:MAG: SCO family protein, partial [Bacteroidetes bacterium]|nr:SCO family protein [Bacteroidota bacterium]